MIYINGICNAAPFSVTKVMKRVEGWQSDFSMRREFHDQYDLQRESFYSQQHKLSASPIVASVTLEPRIFSSIFMHPQSSPTVPQTNLVLIPLFSADAHLGPLRASFHISLPPLFLTILLPLCRTPPSTSRSVALRLPTLSSRRLCSALRAFTRLAQFVVCG